MKKELLFLTNVSRASRYTLGTRRRKGEAEELKKKKKWWFWGGDEKKEKGRRGCGGGGGKKGKSPNLPHTIHTKISQNVL